MFKVSTSKQVLRFLCQEIKPLNLTCKSFGVLTQAQECKGLNLNANGTSQCESLLVEQRRYYAKPGSKKVLTESQIQLQKHTAELGFREKTSIKNTLFTFHDVEKSIEYMESEAFKKAYAGKELFWQHYIRNHKGNIPKSHTRDKCIHQGRYSTGNPCPICRDPYLVVSYKNLKLLKDFISPDTGYIYPSRMTSVCNKQMQNLELAYAKACDLGIIDHYIPHRAYKYSDYIEGWQDHFEPEEMRPSVMLGLVLHANRNKVNDLTTLTEEDTNVISFNNFSELLKAKHEKQKLERINQNDLEEQFGDLDDVENKFL